MKTFNVRMEEELHRVFKVDCYLEGESMNDRIIRLIKEDLEKRSKK